MSDLDLVGLRKIAEAAVKAKTDFGKYEAADLHKLWLFETMNEAREDLTAEFTPEVCLALLDRIAEQQAELAEFRAAFGGEQNDE